MLGIAPMMNSCRDRTAEFQAAAARAAKQYGASSSGSTSAAAPLLLKTEGRDGESSHTEFGRKAARIGHGIQSTCQKLARLAQLAKRTSMFDDPAQEINDLTAVIKQDITALNAAISDLQQTASSRHENNESGSHNLTVVDALKGRLMGATKEFKEVLTMRQDNIKVHYNRRQLFSSVPDPAGAPGGLGGSALTSATRRPGVGGLQSALGAGDSPSGFASSRGPRPGSEQMQLQLAMPAQDAYLASRAEALQNVERTIAELGTIFQQLATMVAEQGELAIRIDENVEETLANVDNAQAHLLKYMNRISSNRWLIMKVFAILLFFMVFFVVFMA